MTALAVRATGRHHAPRKPGPLRRIKLRLMDHNDRMLRDMARQLEEQAQVKANAGKSARTVSVIAPCIAVCGPHPPYLPAIIVAAIVLCVAAPLGVKW